MNRKLDRIAQRLERLEPRTSHHKTTLERCKRVLGCLTEEDEQIAVARIIMAAENDGVRPDTEDAWLARRPQEEQALVAKAAARFNELESERLP